MMTCTDEVYNDFGDDDDRGLGRFHSSFNSGEFNSRIQFHRPLGIESVDCYTTRAEVNARAPGGVKQV